MIEQLKYHYRFKFFDDDVVEYDVDIDQNLRRIKNVPITPPVFKYWTKLEFCQCKNCQFTSDDEEECPVAKNILNIVNIFKDRMSCERVQVEVVSPMRSYFKETDVQDGVRSLMGLIMASSGCKNLSFLAPMAIFHLPFSTVDETIIRVSSFHLLGEVVRNERVELDSLLECYKAVEVVNKGVVERIRQLGYKDSGMNAIVILDTFIKMFSMDFEMDLESIATYFKK